MKLPDIGGIPDDGSYAERGRQHVAGALVEEGCQFEAVPVDVALLLEHRRLLHRRRDTEIIGLLTLVLSPNLLARTDKIRTASHRHNRRCRLAADPKPSPGNAE